MGMAAILINAAEPFEQIVNTLSTRNLVKIAQAVSEKKNKKNTQFYMFIAQEQGQVTPRGQHFDCN